MISWLSPVFSSTLGEIVRHSFERYKKTFLYPRSQKEYFFGASKLVIFTVYFIGHPPARETSQDGQYESGVRERVNLTPIPGRPSGQR